MGAARKYKLNWRPDISDQRDLLFKNYFAIKRTFPKSIDYRSKMSKVEDQGELGSCTANAFAGALEYLYLRKGEIFEASRLFIYFNEREYINEIHNDSGAYLRDGIKTLKAHGVCHEELWPYKIQDFTKKPNAKAYEEAAKRKIDKYLRITTKAEIMTAIADGFPVVFGVPVYSSFDRISKTGIIPNPKPYEEMLGGHAMLVVGYKTLASGKIRFIVRNSWGSRWGNKGYCFIDEQYMQQADDMWAITAE